MQLGDEVFTVYASAYDRVEIPCPVCFGHYKVGITLGDGKELKVQCTYCRSGIGPSTGVISSRMATSRIISGVVTGVGLDWVEVDGSRYSFSKVFSDRNKAEVYKNEMYERVVTQARETNDSLMSNALDKISWEVGYSTEEIRKAEQLISWHSAMISGCIS